jgi:hypothetical protein
MKIRLGEKSNRPLNDVVINGNLYSKVKTNAWNDWQRRGNQGKPYNEYVKAILSPGYKISDSDIVVLGVASSFTTKIPIVVKGGAQYSAVRQARNKSRSAALVFDQQIKKLDQQIESTWGSLRANKSAFSAYQMQVEAQSSAVDGMKKQLDVGLVALVDLLEQEQRLVLAQTNAAKSETEYVNAVYTIKYIMGELTAKKLNLNVKHFDPEAEFRKIKLKIVGF